MSQHTFGVPSHAADHTAILTVFFPASLAWSNASSARWMRIDGIKGWTPMATPMLAPTATVMSPMRIGRRIAAINRSASAHPSASSSPGQAIANSSPPSRPALPAMPTVSRIALRLQPRLHRLQSGRGHR